MKAQNPRLSELFKTPKRKTYTLAGGTAIVVGLFVLFSIRPTFVKIADLNREIKDKEEFLDKLEDKLATVTNLINEKESVKTELAHFEADFPTEVKSGFIVANFSAIAEKFELDLMRVEFNEEDVEEMLLEVDDVESIRVVKVDINIEGRSSDIKRYVDYFESFPRIFDVESITYSKADLSDFQGDLESFKPMESNISMYTYSWKGVEEETESST